MKKILLILILFSIIYVGYWLWQNYLEIGQPTNTINKPVQSSVTIGDTTYIIEIADTDNRRIQGLSGRASLLIDQGMLFIFNTKDRHAFWMKGMNFPLDFIWIDEDKIIDIDENVPVPLTITYTPRYQPDKPVDKVLEVNAGEVKKHNFQIGQKVNFSLINQLKNQ